MLILHLISSISALKLVGISKCADFFLWKTQNACSLLWLGNYRQKTGWKAN